MRLRRMVLRFLRFVKDALRCGVGSNARLKCLWIAVLVLGVWLIPRAYITFGCSRGDGVRVSLSPSAVLA